MTIVVTQARLGVPSRENENTGSGKARCLMCFGCGILGTQTHSQWGRWAGSEAWAECAELWNALLEGESDGEHVAAHRESLDIDMWCGWKGWSADVDASP